MKKSHSRLLCALLVLCFILPTLAGCSINGSDGSCATEPDYTPMQGGEVEYLAPSETAPRLSPTTSPKASESSTPISRLIFSAKAAPFTRATVFSFLRFRQ